MKLKKIKENNNSLKKELEDKLTWAETEKKKGYTAIELLVGEINKLKLQCIKLDGAIVAMRDILKIKKETK